MSSINYYNLNKNNTHLIINENPLSCLIDLPTFTGNPIINTVLSSKECMKLHLNDTGNLLLPSNYCVKINKDGKLMKVPSYIHKCTVFKKNKFLIDEGNYCFDGTGHTTACTNTNILYFKKS
jgi:hypothetical protein